MRAYQLEELTMGLKDRIRRLTTSVAELDDQSLREFAASQPGTTAVAQAEARQEVKVAGEISSLRLVPRPNGSPWLEATISDGTGAMVALWTGRRRIPGVTPGRRLVVSGRGSNTGPGGRLLMYNPEYELF